MFAVIAPHYDLMNRLMTGGMDQIWRKEVIRRAALRRGDQLLDLGTGTGDLAREALRRMPGCGVTAGDFTLEMMLAGKSATENRAPGPGRTRCICPSPPGPSMRLFQAF